MQSKIRRLHYILLICFVFTIPFNLSLSFTNVRINNVFLILLVANAIPLIVYNKNQKPWFSPMVLAFISLYVAYVLGAFSSENFNQAFKDLLEQKIGLFILPIVFYYCPALKFQETKTILLSFVLSCLLTSLYCLAAALYRVITLDTAFLTYHELSMLVGVHAVYLAMHLCFSIIILLYFYSKNQKDQRIHQKVILLLALVVMVTTIFLLAARTHLILLLIGAVGYFIYWFSQRNNMLVALAKAFGIGFFLTLILFLFPQNRERFKQAVNYKNQYGLGKAWGEQQMRPLIWACALELIRSEPLTGLGTGDVQDELEKCYIKNKYTSLTYFEGVRFNAHNQYLETTLALGLGGLFLLLVSLSISLRQGLKQKKILYVLFILLFCASCMTESFLERQNGVIFFAFFNSLLFFNSEIEESDDASL